MKQVLHIFRKDVRQHWAVILVALALQGAYAWDEPRHWVPWEDFRWGRFRGIIIILMILSWWLLVVRVIQSEALVGDRQFWITRPIEWKKLLAAKLLFIAAFVNVPALGVNVYLLARAGFRLELAYVPGLLGMQLQVAALLLLSAAALAAATSNLAQMMLAVLVVGIFIAATATMNAYLPPSGPSNVLDNVQGAVLIGGSCAALVLQYARRKTKQSRLILGGVAALIFVGVLTTPFLFPLSFPYPSLRSGEPRPVQLSLVPEQSSAPEVVPEKAKEVALQIPLRVTGIADDSVVAVNGMRVKLESQDGKDWDSGWFSDYNSLLPDTTQTRIEFKLDKAYFEQTEYSLVSVHVSYALTIWRDRNPTRILTSRGYFPVPGVGLCRIRNGSGTILCRFPLSSHPVVVSTASSENTCPSVKGEVVPEARTAWAWTSNRDSEPIGSVLTSELSFGQWGGDKSGVSMVNLCPGTPLIFSVPEEVEHVRMDMDFPMLRLADYYLN